MQIGSDEKMIKSLKLGYNSTQKDRHNETNSPFDFPHTSSAISFFGVNEPLPLRVLLLLLPLFGIAGVIGFRFLGCNVVGDAA